MYATFEKNKSLLDLSTFGIGGKAAYYTEVYTAQKMQELIAFCTSEKLPFFVLGKGSNCLFDSAGLSRVVIHNKIDFCTELGDGLFHAGAGFSFSLLGMQTAKKGWTGLEFAAGIPATVGGAVYMNAGANLQSTFDTLTSVEYVQSDGSLRCFTKEELVCSYRYSSFQEMKGAIVSANFRLAPSPNARASQLTLLQKRIQTQPYKDKSAGCVFKNPVSHSAGALIDRCGLKGYQVGGAKVSDVHANFLINSANATSDDMRALIAHVKQRVKELEGIDLETEIFWISDS